MAQHGVVLVGSTKTTAGDITREAGAHMNGTAIATTTMKTKMSTNTGAGTGADTHTGTTSSVIHNR